MTSLAKDASIDVSIRTAGRRTLTRRTFRESLWLRQEKLGALRDMIANATTEEMTEHLQGLEQCNSDTSCSNRGSEVGDSRDQGVQGEQAAVVAVQRGSKDVLTKVLEARDVLDGRSLLEYAAVMGKREHFRVLARWLRWKLGVGGLVKQLREPGVNGAPLLFQAATNSRCFHAVKKLLLETLGARGLTQQIKATDEQGKTLLMYAARHADAAVFLRSHELAGALLSKKDTFSLCLARDDEGRNLLHHAAEARSDQMLRKVIAAVRELELWNDLQPTADRQGRTPAMCLLGRKESSSDKDANTGVSGSDGNLRDNLIALLGENADQETRRQHLTSLPKGGGAGAGAGGGGGVGGDGGGGVGGSENASGNLSGVMHAARGGWETFRLACEMIRTDDDQYLDLPLPILLGLSPGSREFDERCAKLLAQAALGGDVIVLKRLSSAILLLEEGYGDGDVDAGGDPRRQSSGILSRWAKKTDYTITASELFRTAVRDQFRGGQDCDDRGIIEGESVAAEKSGSSMAGVIGVGGGSGGGGGGGGGSGAGGGDFKASLFDLAVLSGDKEAVCWAASFVRENAGSPDKVWDLLRGKDCPVSSLAYATATSPTPDVFLAVCDALKEAAENVGEGDEEVEGLFRGEFELHASQPFTPLAGAVFCGNSVVVNAVFAAYGHPGLAQEEIMDQIQGVLLDRKKQTNRKCDSNDRALPPEAHLLLRGYGPGLPKEVLQAVNKELKKSESSALRSKDCGDAKKLRKSFNEAAEKAELEDSVARAKRASEGGTYDGLRALIEKGWDCHDYLPTIISRIGDHEASVIDTVLCAIENARTTIFSGISNPFVMKAIASSCMAAARKERPADKNSLNRLQRNADKFILELLYKLPGTVRGVGLELIGSFDLSVLDGRKGIDGFPGIRDRRQDMANLIGYIAVRWMLEPSLKSELSDRGSLIESGTEEPIEDEDESTIESDPLQQALNRGSKAHEFVNAPLVLDYMQLKWSCTIPNWTRRFPLDYNVNEGFYTYGNADRDAKIMATWADSLLRLLQGWESGSTTMMLFRDKESSLFRFPHTTILPGLQFSMAGIVGRPDEFFLVPSVRFFFEAFSYLSMLGLYCSCVSIEDSDVIPPDEIAFYIFALGLLWREIQEFRDALPPLPRTPKSTTQEPNAFQYGGDGEGPPAAPQHRLTAGVQRYFTQDNWNILDTASIAFLLVAFLFRVLALVLKANQDVFGPILGADDFSEQAFFVARFFLAAIAPFLFGRVLSLAQVDKYLGPMTQIIWAMLFHLARFSVFMLVVMASFALAFFSLYGSCNGELGTAYSTLSVALLSMFKAMLGDPNFEAFDQDRDLCTGPAWEYDAGITLLVMYMVTMAILMLNLLIAVLGTVHDSVSQHAEVEFNLARNQFIQRGASVVNEGRLPPPFNLVMAASLIVIDVFGEICYQLGLCSRVWPKAGRDRASARAAAAAAAADVAASAGGGGGGGGGGGVDVSSGGGDGRLMQGKKRLLSTRPSERLVGVSKPRTEAAPAAEPAYNANDDGGVPPSGKTGAEAEEDDIELDDESFRPLSQTNAVLVLQGALQRLLFSCSMGLFALTGSALLWVVSLPSVAMRILRWQFSANDMKPSRHLASLQVGHARPVLSVLIHLCATIFGLIAAVLFCSFCVLGSIVLWLRGLWGVFDWWYKRHTAEIPPCADVGRGAVMPGASGVDDNVWRVAKDIVEASNVSWNVHKDKTAGGVISRHFDVESLLKMTTGLDLGHVSSLVRRKEEEDEMEGKLLREIDAKRSGVGNLCAVEPATNTAAA